MHREARGALTGQRTWMTRYRWGSRAILQNSAASSLNLGLLSASIIQPEEEQQKQGRGEMDKEEEEVRERNR